MWHTMSLPNFNNTRGLISLNGNLYKNNNFLNYIRLFVFSYFIKDVTFFSYTLLMRKLNIRKKTYMVLDRLLYIYMVY